MYINRITSEHIYSSYEVGQLIKKTPGQISRLIDKGYLQATLTKSGYVVTDQQLGNYYLYGQFGRRPPKKGRKKKKNV
ncbi:MAG: hypothetical protein D4S00_06365 [Streptomycetaceae bacterium]|nr:MAG: hypothetical protein D4S00_06365 [Streptomycetaceae bacterium]